MFLYYIINKTRKHKTIRVCVCVSVYIYTVDPHYSQIPYLYICLRAKICNPQISICATFVVTHRHTQSGKNLSHHM